MAAADKSYCLFTAHITQPLMEAPARAAEAITPLLIPTDAHCNSEKRSSFNDGDSKRRDLNITLEHTATVVTPGKHRITQKGTRTYELDKSGKFTYSPPEITTGNTTTSSSLHHGTGNAHHAAAQRSSAIGDEHSPAGSVRSVSTAYTDSVVNSPYFSTNSASGGSTFHSRASSLQYSESFPFAAPAAAAPSGSTGSSGGTVVLSAEALMAQQALERCMDDVITQQQQQHQQQQHSQRQHHQHQSNGSAKSDSHCIKVSSTVVVYDNTSYMCIFMYSI
jgi:hypothetical protein